MSTSHTKINLYAFWKHSQYPYILGGCASKMGAHGSVYIDSYMAWFYPILLLPIEEGELLQKELKQLNKEYEKAKIDLDKKFYDMIPKEVRK